MYVCLCKGVTDHRIRAEVEAGAKSLRDVSRRLGVATQCGKCAGCAREIIREAVACGEPACCDRFSVAVTADLVPAL